MVKFISLREGVLVSTNSRDWHAGIFCPRKLKMQIAEIFHPSTDKVLIKLHNMDFP
jgi:hypothetical protein